MAKSAFAQFHLICQLSREARFSHSDPCFNYMLVWLLSGALYGIDLEKWFRGYSWCKIQWPDCYLMYALDTTVLNIALEPIVPGCSFFWIRFKVLVLIYKSLNRFGSAVLYTMLDPQQTPCYGHHQWYAGRHTRCFLCSNNPELISKKGGAGSIFFELLMGS